MTTYDLIAEPCGWQLLAPLALRRSVFGCCFKWHQYSSSGYLQGTNPELWPGAEKLHGSLCPSLSIELLNADVAKPWERLGLCFARETQLQESLFIDALLDALVLIHLKPPIYATVNAMCRSLHPLVCSNGDVDVSFSDPELPFSIFASCPPKGTRYRIERLAENIIHEALHLQLTLVERRNPLVHADCDGTLAHSPWKGEPRKLQGLVHGIYVFGNLREFWACVSKQRPYSAEFGNTRVASIEAEMRSLLHVVGCDGLTASGQDLVSSFLRPYYAYTEGGKV